MKKNLLSKLIAVIIAIVLMATASLTAFAAGIGNGTITSTDTSVTIPKSISLKNSSQGSYYGPAITYSYSIAPVAPPSGTTITDASTGTTLPVQAGIANGATLGGSGTVAFANPAYTITNLDDEGVESTQNITVNVDLTKFTTPGIYRYVITDTTAIADLYDAGIVRPNDYDTTRFLDVYIRYNADSTALVVGGYTLLKTNAGTADVATSKDTGFNRASEAPTGGTEKTDVYRSYNIRVEKHVQGTMGDRINDFPFTATIGNNGGQTYYYGKGTDAASLSQSSATTQNFTLRDGEAFYIRGLSPHATIAYTETNNTVETYKVTIMGKNTTSGSGWTLLTAAADEQKPIAPNGTMSLTAGAITNYDTANRRAASGADAATVATEATVTNYRDVEYINLLGAVSPTGLALRFAPFIILFIGGSALAIIFTRRKRSAKDAI